MHAHDDAGELGAGKDVGDVEEQVEVQGQRRRRALADSGERTQVQNIESGKSPLACMSLKEHKRLKHGKDVPLEAQLQYLKPGIFAQALVHNKFVFTLPKDVRGDKADQQVLASHAYSSKKFWYVDCKILSPEVPEDEKIIQMPVARGNTPTTNHKHNPVSYTHLTLPTTYEV